MTALAVETARTARTALSTALTTAAAALPGPMIRDIVCSWLSMRGLMVDGPEPRYNDRQDVPLDRAARIAHRDVPGHVGPLDLCQSDLCRALSEAGAR